MIIQSTSQLWITAAFFLNRDYIARVLCINKDIPDSGCNGACQLKKEIEKDKEKQDKSGIDNKVKEILVYYPSTLPTTTFIAIDWSEKTYNNAYFTSFLPEGFIHNIFHPPIFTA